MPVYRATFGGKTLKFTADTPEQAANAARMYLAGRGRADEVVQERALAERNRGLDDPLSPEFQALREQGQMQGTAAAAGPTAAILGGGAVAGLAPAGALAGLAKDTAIYGAAEGAEKAFGLPSWTGEAVGAINPARSLGKLLLGGAFGGTKKGAAVAATQASEAAMKKAADNLAERQAARKLRERALDLAERKVVVAEKRLEMLGSKAVRPPKTAPVAPAPAAPPVVAPAAPTASTAASVAVPDTSQIVLQLQQQMGTSSGRKVVRELLAQMPKEQAAQIKQLLMRGQEHPATVLGALFDPTNSAVGKVAKPGAELARLLGQIP